jgi:hypothetical protein
MYHQFNIQQLYVLPTQCIYVFCVDLRTNSDYFPIQTDRQTDSKQTSRHAATATTLLLSRQQTENFNALKVPKHCPLVPSATVGSEYGKALGSKEGASVLLAVLNRESKLSV